MPPLPHKLELPWVMLARVRLPMLSHNLVKPLCVQPKKCQFTEPTTETALAQQREKPPPPPPHPNAFKHPNPPCLCIDAISLVPQQGYGQCQMPHTMLTTTLATHTPSKLCWFAAIMSSGIDISSTHENAPHPFPHPPQTNKEVTRMTWCGALVALHCDKLGFRGGG